MQLYLRSRLTPSFAIPYDLFINTIVHCAPSTTPLRAQARHSIQTMSHQVFKAESHVRDLYRALFILAFGWAGSSSPSGPFLSHPFFQEDRCPLHIHTSFPCPSEGLSRFLPSFRYHLIVSLVSTPASCQHHPLGQSRIS